MSKILQGLNPEQKEAVTHKKGPLLIIAGAGTGKTTVITRRIAWLLDENLAKTNEILALTFTDKAAKEMLERVDILVPYGYTDIWVSTFHAFGDRILRENALEAGLNPDFKVLTQAEAAVFFREHLFEFSLDYYRPLADPTRFIEALLGLFSRARDEDISPKEYLDYAQDFMIKAKADPDDAAAQELATQQMEVAEAYAKYQELLAQESKVDFANQFYLTLRLLREHPLILKRYQEQFKYILVDEFQDTNYAQYQLAKLLAGKDANITVTGDDDQCIYRFRGAAYSNLLNFIKDFPKAAKVNIVKNYRSTQPILDSAYQLIQKNNPERFEVKAGINKQLEGITKKGEATEHLHFDSRSTEADKVAKIIKDKVKSKKYTFSDFAILVRSNSDGEPFLQALNMQQIPWQFSGNQGLYTREEVKICINFLKSIANPSDSMSLYYLVSSEVYNMNLQDLSRCNHYARRCNKPLYLVFKQLANIPELEDVTEKSRDKIKDILKDIEKFMKVSREHSSGRLLYIFLTETGYLKRLTKHQSLVNEAKIQNLAKFFKIVQDFQGVAKEDKVNNFVNYLNLLIEAGDDPATVEADIDTDSVNVLTIHKAKGLEFRAVFMVSLVNLRFPWPHRRQPIELPDALIKEILPTGDFHIQEERRLFYVGMTRAKEELYFTSAADYGGKRMKRVSQFVIEALGKEMEEAGKKKASALEAIKRFAPPQESPKQAPKKLPKDQLISLSYYKIDDYLTCPLKYKYVHILRVPLMEHHTLIYGKAMHDAVSKYFQNKMGNKKMELAALLEAFRQSFDPQGFLDQKHQEERLRTGEEALVRFYNEEKENPSKPKLIEEKFSFILDNNKISGRFDRVDETQDGDVIIDFKTSNIRTQKKANEEVKKSLQLKLYTLAYKNIFGKEPKGVQLRFLETGLVGNYEVKEAELSKVVENVREVSEGIRGQRFEATPEYNACKFCAYSGICQFAVK
ncbi:ATP-dependent helicase [Candidatus Omnitrophota bacterium]